MNEQPTTMQRAAGYADALLDTISRETTEEIAAYSAAIILTGLCKTPNIAAEILAEVQASTNDLGRSYHKAQAKLHALQSFVRHIANYDCHHGRGCTPGACFLETGQYCDPCKAREVLSL